MARVDEKERNRAPACQITKWAIRTALRTRKSSKPHSLYRNEIAAQGKLRRNYYTLYGVIRKLLPVTFGGKLVTVGHAIQRVLRHIEIKSTIRLSAIASAHAWFLRLQTVIYRIWLKAKRYCFSGDSCIACYFPHIFLETSFGLPLTTSIIGARPPSIWTLCNIFV